MFLGPCMGKSAILLTAIARLLDLSGQLQPLPDLDSATAMHEDWKKVGDDIRRAMREAEATLPADAEVRALVEA